MKSGVLIMGFAMDCRLYSLYLFLCFGKYTKFYMLFLPGHSCLASSMTTATIYLEEKNVENVALAISTVDIRD